MTRARVPAVRVDDVTVRYGEVLALEGATLSLEAGRVCGIIGMNGAGKSTLFKAMMGIVRPDRGRIALEGLSTARARKSGTVGYVPQNEAVDWAFPVSVRDVVTMGRYGRMGPTRRPRRADRAAVAEALDRVGLIDLAERQIGRLSGGQRKRAFVARAIAQGAGVMLLDEPFAGVDRRSEQTITRLLRELAADGAAILVSTHDLHALPQLADEAILLNRRVLLHDTPEAVLRPENLALAFGTPPGDGDLADADPSDAGAGTGADLVRTDPAGADADPEPNTPGQEQR
ncbi:metal ABC transporter ATP-binding protein [Leucobacter sp. CSA1]|uniref:Metal ABC transporter ATP-binding protein n=1 Tax=Leucobacter chromiisoli TaxID=2796471 RepID=A0A934Q773_9MICO|nr:metal ABC transporter ATP-binding protein [Leucobacter chromiisoli]MBK0418630.1 metal ABC transporter ATP-binding protein [Leucobacter chromiisoli]